MAIDREAVAVAIEARIDDNWNTTDIAWPNRPFSPPNGPWIKPDILWGEGAELDRGGDKRNRVVGVLSIALFAKPSVGLGTIRGYADTLAALFTHVEVGGARFRAPSGPTRAPDEVRTPLGGTSSQPWAQLTVSCPFYVEETV